MSTYAQAAARKGTHILVGADVDMGDVDPSMYTREPGRLPPKGWCVRPAPKPAPAEPGKVSREALSIIAMARAISYLP